LDGCSVGFADVVAVAVRPKLTFCRSNLEDDNVKKEYERGYKLLLDFFHQHL